MNRPTRHTRWLFALAALGMASAAAVCTAQDTDTSPIVIRRVTIDRDGLAEHLAHHKDLLRLPQARFEQALREANHPSAELRRTTALLEVRGTARLDRGQLVGKALLRFHQPPLASPLVRLQPINVALRGEARLDGAPAAIADAGPHAWQLLSPHSGEHVLEFDWTARTDERPDGLYAVLDWPEAPLAMLTLTLEADRLLDLRGVRQAAARVRPGPEGRREWELVFGGSPRPTLELLLRPASAEGRPTLVTARQMATHQVGPDGLRSSFDVDLEAIQGRLPPIHVQMPAGWRPESVLDLNRPGQVLTWTFAEEKTGGVLHVLPGRPTDRRLHLDIRCRPMALPPLENTAPIQFPFVTVREAASSRPDLRVQTAAGLRLSEWQFGDFRPAAPLAVDRDGAETYALEPHTLGHCLMGRCPQARLQTGRTDFLVGMRSWWQIGEEGSTLQVQLLATVREGHLFQLPFRLPAGWELVDCSAGVAGEAAAWGVSLQGQRLLLEYRQGALPPHSQVRAELRLRRRLPLPAGDGPFLLTVPHVVPEGAAWIDGGLAVTLPRDQGVLDATPPRYTGSMRKLAARPTAAAVGTDLPWSGRPVDLYYVFHDANPGGELELMAGPPAFRAFLQADVALTGPGVVATYRVDIQPLAGIVQRVTLVFSEPVPLSRWSVAEGPARLEQATERSGQPGTWDLVFASALSGPVTLHAQATLPFGGELRAPLPRPADSDLVEGLVLLRLPAGLTADVDSKNLWRTEEAGLPVAPHLPPVWQVYRYGPLPASLCLRDLRMPLLDAAVLTATHWRVVGRDGSLRSIYTATVRNPRHQQLWVRLPKGAILRALRLDGKHEPALSQGDEGYLLPCRRDRLHIELVFDEPRQGPELLPRFEFSGPAWPSDFPVLQMRSLWLLPRGMIPVGAGPWRRGPEPAALTWRDPLPLLPKLWGEQGIEEPEWAQQQREALENAWKRLVHQQPALTREPLGRLLLQLEREASEDGLVFLVDEEALAASRISLDRLRPSATDGFPWSEGGLVLLPCPEGVLITTQNQLDAWGLPTASAVQAALGPALADAVLHGHDHTGRFRTLAESALRWPIGTMEGGLENGGFLPRDGAWEQWEYLGETGAGASFRCLHQTHLHLLGAVLAAVLVGVGLRRRRSAGRLYFVILASLVIGVAGQRLLPAELRAWSAWPLASAGVLLFWLLRSPGPAEAAAAAGSTAESRSHLRWGGTAVGLLLGGALLAAQSKVAQPVTPAPPIVFLLPTEEGADEPQVHVSKETWQRILRRLAPAHVAAPRYLLTRATHRGTVRGARAVFETVLDIHVSAADRVAIPLAFDQARLHQAVLLRGWRVQPADLVPAADRPGFTLTVDGPGRFSLWLTWEAGVTVRGADFSLRARVPVVPSTEATFDVPTPADGLKAMASQGAQWLHESADLLSLHAELGRTEELNFAWRREPRAPARTTVQEFHICEWQPERISLRSLYRFSIHEGSLPRLLVELPPSLDVVRVELRPERDSELPTALLRRWSVEERLGRRLLVVEPVLALSASVRLLVECIVHPALASSPAEFAAAEFARNLTVLQPVWLSPALLAAAPETQGRGVLTLRLALPVPRLGQETKRDAQLALRTERVRLEQLQPRGMVRAASPAEALRSWPTGFGTELLAAEAALYRLTAGAPFCLLVRGRFAAADIQASQVLTVHIGDADPILQAQLTLAARAEPFAYAEWQVPRGLRLASVSGEELLRWTRRDDVVQLWFRRPTSIAHVRAEGVLATVRSSGGREQLTVPVLRLAGPDPTPTRLSIVSTSPTQIDVLAAVNLREQTGPAERPHVIAQYSGLGAYKLVLAVQLAKPEFTTRMITTLSGSPVALGYRTAVECHVQSGFLQRLVFRVRHWPGERPPVLLAEEGLRYRSRRTGDGEWLFDVECPEQATRFDRQLRLQFVGTLTMLQGETRRLPEIDIQEDQPPQRYIMRPPRGLQLRAAVPLPPADANGLILLPATAAEGLVLSPAPAAAGGAVHVFLAECRSSMTAFPGFLQEVRYTLWHEDAAELKVRLPTLARLLQVTIDGRPVRQFRRQDRDLVIPLPAQAGWACVTIVVGGTAAWHGEKAAAELPQTPGLSGYPLVSTVHAPAPERQSAHGSDTGRLAAAQGELARAQALHRLALVLADRLRQAEGASAMVRAQELFYARTHQARQHLRVVRATPDNAVVRQLDALLADHHRAFRDTRWEPARRKAEELVRSRSVSSANVDDSADALSMGWNVVGQPSYLTLAAAGPELPLRLDNPAVLLRRQWVEALGVLAAGVLAGLAGRSSRARRLARLFWPELLAGGGVLWWLLLWPRYAGVFLVFAGFAARLLQWQQRQRKTDANASATLPALAADGTFGKGKPADGVRS